METAGLKRFAQGARSRLIGELGVKLDQVMGEYSLARRGRPGVVASLEGAIASEGRDRVLDRVAYTWFNRFCALRFMDVNGYNAVGVVSPGPGGSQPEILAEAKAGHFEAGLPGDRVLELLGRNEEEGAYGLLLVGVCNQLWEVMPDLFERLDDYTELLLPGSLLSGNGFLAGVREAMTVEVCGGVEVMGWLYQFYIGERKDEIFNNLKKNIKIEPSDIPPATQLFTPDWIVRYLVDNSLGRLWMLNRPESQLIKRMNFYVGSGKWEVGSGKWGGSDGGQKLSGVDCLAEGDEFGGGGVSGNAGVSPGGAVWSDESATAGGGVDSVEYCGGSGAGFDGGVQAFSGDRAGVKGGGGNAVNDRDAFGLSGEGSGGSNAAINGGDQANDLRSAQKFTLKVGDTNFSPTSHFPLPTSYLKISSPEEIKVCDPACGSGHILVYAFDLLYAIYEEQGYSPVEIPGLILEHNLFGIDIDGRAVWLARFALLMKGRERDRRFLRRGVLPQVCLLESVVFGEGELGQYFDVVGRDLFSGRLLELLHQFKEGDHFGSLIRPVGVDCDLLNQEGIQENLFLHQTHEKVLKVLRFAEFLSCRYHVVVANPPYMGSKGMSGRLGAYLKENYPSSKSDLFAAFIERCLDLVVEKGMVAMITMQSWMFLSSFEKLRSKILNEGTILSMAHLGARAFDSIGGEVVSTTAFVLSNHHQEDYKGDYLRLIDGNSEDEKAAAIREAIKNPDCGWLYRAAAADFKKIPGGAIAYWVSNSVLNLFVRNKKLESISKPRQGATTSDNNRFLRLWYEVPKEKFGIDILSVQLALDSKYKWFPYNKGGDFRRWYGNQEYVINYEDDGREIKEFHEELNKTRPGGRLKNQNYYFKPCVSWSKISSGIFAVRYFPAGFIFDVAGSAVFFKDESSNLFYSGLLNTNFVRYVLTALSPTLNFEAEHLCKIPVVCEESIKFKVIKIIEKILSVSKLDWDSYETSWDFTTNPLIQLSQTEKETSPLPTSPHSPLPTLYSQLRQQWATTTQQMQQLEEQNNQIFIQAYGLQNELTPQVPLKEITLTCNPHYRYSIGECEVGSEQWEEMEKRLKTDTIQELISYAIGCIFGRYSLEQPGLILANQNQTLPNPEGEKFFAPTNHSPLPTSHSPLPTPQNIIPILDGDWFPDDITQQFRTFLQTALGPQNYQQNLNFIEQTLGKDIRKYFLKDFYPDHLKRYKKRPIYWLYSSPKGHFNALIYMHRYQSDTTSTVLEYLRQYQTKLTTHQTHLQNLLNAPNTPKPEQTKATRTLQTLKKILPDLDTYDRDILHPLALQQIAIDLDDGVKTNYPKLGKALKPIPGLSS